MDQQQKNIQKVVYRYVDKRKEVIHAAQLLNDYSSMMITPEQQAHIEHPDKGCEIEASTLSSGCGVILNSFASTSCWPSYISPTKIADSRNDVISADYRYSEKANDAQIGTENLMYQTKSKNENSTLLYSVANPDVTAKLHEKNSKRCRIVSCYSFKNT